MVEFAMKYINEKKKPGDVDLGDKPAICNYGFSKTYYYLVLEFDVKKEGSTEICKVKVVENQMSLINYVVARKKGKLDKYTGEIVNKRYTKPLFKIECEKLEMPVLKNTDSQTVFPFSLSEEAGKGSPSKSTPSFKQTIDIDEESSTLVSVERKKIYVTKQASLNEDITIQKQPSVDLAEL